MSDIVYLTKAEFQGYRATVDSTINAIQLKIYGRDPDEPIGYAQLDSTLQNLITTLPNTYYAKGTVIRTSDLPVNVATKAYVQSLTKGVTYNAVTAPTIIDEVVVARGGQDNLKAYIDTFSTKAGLITNINALSTGTIDKERCEVHDHNDLTNRDATDCHPQSAITSLATDLGNLTPKATIISVINDSEELEQISGTLVELSGIVHNTLDGRAGEGISDCHSMTVITGLDGAISGLDGRIGDLESAISGAIGTHLSLADALKCIVDVIEAMDGELDAEVPTYTSQLLSCLQLFPWQSV
jgi:hypothetical protein